MELTPTMMYWITRLDYLQVAFGCIGGIGLVASGVVMFFSIEDRDKKRINLSAVAIAISLLFTLAACFVPTSKDVFTIYGVPAIATQGQKAIDNAEAAVRAWLVKQAEDKK